MPGQIPEELFGPAPGTAPAAGSAIPEELLGPPAPGYDTAPSNLGWSDVGPALASGIRRGIGDVGETFGLEGSSETPPAAASYELSDIWHPGSALAKTAYRVGAGAPTIAGGIAGGAGGEALAGPIGGVAGGALGAAGMSALQTLGPVYHRQLKASPDNPKGAWDRAVDEAMAAGAFSGVGWAAFPLKFFKGPLWNLATQTGIIQPGLAVGHQATSNVIEGRPVGEGTLGAFGEGVAGTAIPALGTAAVRGAGRFAGRDQNAAARAAAAVGPPSTEDIFSAGSKAYQNARGLGIQFEPSGLSNLADDIANDLHSNGFRPMKSIAPKTFDAINELKNFTSPDISDIDAVRKTLGRLARAPHEEGAAASIAIGKLDDYMGNLQPNQVTSGAHNIPALQELMAQGRQNWRIGKTAESLDDIANQVENSAHPVTKLVSSMRSILNDPNKLNQFNPEEQGIIGDIVHGRGLGMKLANLGAKLDPHSGTGFLSLLAALHETGLAGFGVPLAGKIAAAARDRIAMNRLGNLRRQVQMRAPAAPVQIPMRPLEGIPGIVSRFNPNISPFAQQPQQQARGGRAGKDGKAFLNAMALARQASRQGLQAAAH